MSEFHWQHIDFANHSNPYISMTQDDFKWIQEHYTLDSMSDNMWLATQEITYTVKATDSTAASVIAISKAFPTLTMAEKFYNKLTSTDENSYQTISLYKTTKDLTTPFVSTTKLIDLEQPTKGN